MTGEETINTVEIAKGQFDEGRYSECLTTLNSMKTSTALNIKQVQLNIILCTYLKKGSEHDLEWLLENLYSVEGKMNKESEEEEIDEVEKAVLLYNIALVHFQTKNFDKAVVILEKLFKLIEPLEEGLVYKICFLLVECYLSTYQTEGAAIVVYYLDKQMSAKSAESEIHKARMHQYKTRLFAQQKCLKACKREIKNVLSVSGTTASSLFLKSEFEYLRNNFKKSCKLLNSAPKTCPSKEHIPTLYYNNFGCMHFKMKKYNLGVLYLSQALEANTKAVKAAPQGCNSTMYSINHHYQILYNYGIVLLHAGQPKAAFNCLSQAATVYSRNPRLWLRIAECAIGVVKQSQEIEQIQNCKSSTVKAIVGSGIYRKTILNTNFQNHPKKCSAGLLSEDPTPSLTYAALCLNNALELLPPSNSGGPVNISALPAAPLKDVSKLRASILCNQAYVWLGLGDPLQALKPAQELFSLTSAPVNLRLLGSVYAAEALILLNRNNEATNCLAPEFVGAIINSTNCQNKTYEDDASSTGSSPIPGKVPANQETTVQDVHNIIILNSVALYCMKRDLNRAKRILAQHLSTLNDMEVPAQATMLLVYIELRQGNTEAALSILKQQQINLQLPTSTT
ncbi:hypothetical protein ACHWQZ_G008035 [Mnemiopsis leidyi]